MPYDPLSSIRPGVPTPSMSPFGGAASSPSFGGAGSWLGNHADLLTSIGSALLANYENPQAAPLSNLGPAVAVGAKSDRSRRGASMTTAFLKKRFGLTDEEAAAVGSNPEILTQLLKTPDQPNSYEEYVRAQQDPAYAGFLNQGKAPQGTDDMRELAVINQERESKGLPPYRLDEWITTRAKAGATGIQLPAEVGARIGLGDQFLGELNGQGLAGKESLRERIQKTFGGSASQQAMSRSALQLGMGDAGDIWRRVESGKEALVRGLTGAGMSVQEADAQASRYAIGPTDSVETMLRKMDGLEADLKAVRSGAIGARSGSFGSPGEGAPDPAADPLGIR